MSPLSAHIGESLTYIGSHIRDSHDARIGESHDTHIGESHDAHIGESHEGHVIPLRTFR